MTEAVHQIAREGFEAQVDSYEQARPSYPDEAVEQFAKSCDLKKGCKVLDLASGTGKWTQKLVSCGVELDITACEPAENMREKFVELFPNIPCVEGTSVALPFDDNSFDVVTIAQAFHWFANVESLIEIARVLKKNGSLVLIWNLEDRKAAAWLADLRDLYEQYEGGSPQYRLGLHKAVWTTAEAEQLFHVPLEEFDFQHYVDNTRREVWLRVLSKSYVARQADDVHQQLEAETQKILDQYFGDSEEERAKLVRSPLECNLRITRKK